MSGLEECDGVVRQHATCLLVNLLTCTKSEIDSGSEMESEAWIVECVVRLSNALENETDVDTSNLVFSLFIFF